MNPPSVAIIGRPNVGKSSLLNFLARRRISIVDPTAGVTRDRIGAIVEHRGRYFELIDTGGYGIDDPDNLTEQVRAQIRQAIEEASLILFVVDARSGLVSLDTVVASLLRGFSKPVFLICNKVDSAAMTVNSADFFSLGFGEPVTVSCKENRGRDQLLEKIMENLGGNSAADVAEPELKIAVVGKRNAGKSTLINAWAGQKRVIVSEVAGTTRDSVDVHIDADGRRLVVIDTAGVRKRSKMTASDLEFYSFHRAQRSIRRADLVILLLDATLESGDVDQKLAAYIQEQFKPTILAVNKWDLVGQRATPAEFAQYVGKIFPQLEFAPMACISAKDNEHVQDMLRLAFSLHQQASTRLSTGQLNQAVQDIIRQRGPSSRSAKPVKVYYATQIGVNPPSIVLSVNQPDLVTEEYRRFFIRQLRQRTSLSEVPIRLLVRSHHRSAEKAAKGETGNRGRGRRSKGDTGGAAVKPGGRRKRIK